MEGKFLTHREIEVLCDKFMDKRGWYKVKGPLVMRIGALKNVPDRVYTKHGEVPVVLEIKPENTDTGEIKKGIGQMVCCLPYKVRPYLVLSEVQWHLFAKIIEQLKWLGVLSYPKLIDPGSGLTLELKSERYNLENLVVIGFEPQKEMSFLEKKGNLRTEYFCVYKFIKERLAEDFYPIDLLVDWISEEYSAYKIDRGNVSAALSLAGIKKRHKLSRAGYYIYLNQFMEAVLKDTPRLKTTASDREAKHKAEVEEFRRKIC